MTNRLFMDFVTTKKIPAKLTMKDLVRIRDHLVVLLSVCNYGKEGRNSILYLLYKLDKIFDKYKIELPKRKKTTGTKK